MNKRPLVLLSLALFALSGCSNVGDFFDTRPDPVSYWNYSPEAIVRMVEIDDSEFDQIAFIYGPEESRPVGTALEWGLERSKIRSLVGKGNFPTLSHQLYINFSYNGDWRFYNRAAIPGGERLEVVEISRDVGYCSTGGCTLYETVAVNITDQQLNSWADDGISIRVQGRSSGYSSAFHLSSNMIKGQIQAVQDFRNRL